MSGLEHPRRIGPFHLVQVIGEGGMGVVYEAEQKEPVRRRVALKVIKVGMHTKEVIGRFEAERQALAVMDHPGIAKVFDAGATEDGRPYFAMELVRGTSLDHYCDQQRLTTRQRVELFVGVCEAVQHAHQKGVIHRDLKPSNILVSEEGGRPIPRIIDFGIAKATGHRLTDRTVVTTHGQAVGTLAYMSPEQAEMSGLDVDTRTDIYSLSVVLFELLVGRLPLDPKVTGGPAFLGRLVDRERSFPTLLEGLSAWEKARLGSLATTHGTDGSGLRRELSGDLQWIVLKGMEKDRRRRYETANGLAMDLRRYLADEPVVARPPTAAYRARKFVRRNRVAVGASMAVVLALVVGATVATIGLVRARAAERVARQEAETAAQVSDFLEGLFEINDPGRTQGNTITAREILEAGAERIETELADQPEVRARLTSTIGRVFSTLGLLDPARSMLERSMEIQERLDGDGSVALQVRTLRVLGSVAAREGNVAIADSLYRRAASVLLRAEGESLAYADLLGQRGYHAAVFLGDVDTGDSLVREAIAVTERHLGPDGPRVADHLATLAFFHDDDPGFAEPLQRRVLEIRERSYGWRHTATLGAGQNLSLTLAGVGRLEEAESLMRRVVSGQEIVYGPDHPTLAISRMDLSIVLEDLERHAEAVELRLTALSVLERTYGDDAPMTSYARQFLAASLAHVGRLDEAELQAVRALRGLEAGVGGEHNWSAQAMTALGLVRTMQGRSAEAEALYRDAATIQERNWGVGHRTTYRPLLGLAKVLERGARWPSVDTAYQRALRACTDSWPPGHPCHAEAGGAYEGALRAQGRDVEADSLARILAPGLRAR